MFQQSSVACLSLLLQQPGGAASLEYKYMVISIEPKTKKQNNSKKKKKHLIFVPMQQKSASMLCYLSKTIIQEQKSSGAWIKSRFV
jgi:hypothetical protein